MVIRISARFITKIPQVFCWLCCKKMLGHNNTERHFSSGGNIEEIGHESNLSANVAFPNYFNLSLPDHVNDLIPADGPPRRLETEEAESRVDPALYESVILLDYVIEVCAAAYLSGDDLD